VSAEVPDVPEHPEAKSNQAPMRRQAGTLGSFILFVTFGKPASGWLKT
jgi:hypothetical protein